jgi:hypothetical protein
MASLWADGWFYISAGGFLISCVLFVFLLGQYRAAVEAEDEGVTENPAPSPFAPEPVQKVYVPKGLDAPKPGVEVSKPLVDVVLPIPVKPMPAPVEAPAPKSVPSAAAPAPAPATNPPKKTDSTGGLSPAVVYLQNMKTQMDRLDKDITGLKTLAGQHAAQSETILKRLAELTQKLESLPAAPAAAAPATPLPSTLELAPATPAPAPEPEKPALVIEPERPAPKPEPAPMKLESAPAKSEPLRTIELEVAAAAPKAEPAPAPADADKTMIIEPTVAPIKLSDTKSIPLPKPQGLEEAGASPAPAAEPAKEAPAETPVPKPARKGPVWPI